MRKSDLPDGYFSSQVLLNGLVFRQFSRIKCTAFRGESSSSGHNMASFGRGIYSTKNRSYAKKFGSVRRVEVEEYLLNLSVLGILCGFSIGSRSY